MKEFFTDEMRRNPYPVYARMRAASPALHVAAADLWMLFDYEGVKRALSDHDAFSNSVSRTRGHGFEWLMFMDPPRHTKLRAIILRAFTPRSIAALEPRVREISHGLLDAVAPRGEMDLERDFATPLPIMVIAEMLGLPAEDWERLKRWSDAIMGLAATVMGTPESSRLASEAFLAANEQMRAYLLEFLAARRTSPGDDLLSRLAGAEVDGEKLTEDELLRFVQLLLAAGTETTTNLIDNAMLCFHEHPEQFARLRAAPELLPSAIEEVLRYRSPAQALFRATKRDVELGGQTIPAGKMVLALAGSANRDAAAFPDADRFDVGRDPNPHIAFGHGIHFCLGAALSRLEARVALGDLLARFPRIEVTAGPEWTPRKPFHVHGPASLPVRLG